MTVLSFSLGLFLVALVALDAVVTTVAPRGAGPLTDRVGKGLWRLALATHRRRPAHRLLQATGTAIPVASVLVWVGLLWAGWWLVSLTDPQAVVATSSGRPADAVERIYFVGFTLFTLGTGDFVPGTTAWRVLTPAVSLNGLLLATLGVTYLIPLASAANEKRALATLTHALGKSPVGIVRGVDWRGDLTGFESVLIELGSAVTRHAERHLAYPVLHFLHATTASEAATPTMARLDEALTLILHGLDLERGPASSVLALARGGIDRFLETAPRHLSPATEEPCAAPPAPSLARLRDAGLPTVPDATFECALDELTPRRRRLLELVESDGWTWSDVSPASIGSDRSR